MASKSGSQGGIMDGVENPQGLLMAAFVPVYAALVPVTVYLSKPSGYVNSAVGLALKLLPSGSTIPQDRRIAALATLYIFAAVPLTGALSVAAQASSRNAPFDNNTPRAHQNNLRGLPLRIRSAHLNILENFPLWALAAALTQILEPTNELAINLLGLAALAKIVVFPVAYALDLAPIRSLAHFISTSAVIAVVHRLAVGF